MIHKIKSLLLYGVVLAATFSTIPEYASKDMPLDFYTSLKPQFPWVTQQRARLIRAESLKYNINPYLIAAIIERESSGKAYLQGPLRTVKLYRKGELVQEPHRAIGLMQVMTFYAPRSKLFNERYNIALGTKIIYRCLQQDTDLTEALRCYNSGANSRIYNYPYINDVIASFNHLNGKESLYAAREDNEVSSVSMQ